MKRTKRLVVIITVAVIALTAVSAWAVLGGERTAGGGYERNIIERVNFSVSQTEFAFDEPDEAGELPCYLTFSFNKAEPFFFARLDSLVIEGDGVSGIVYEGDTAPEYTVVPDDAGLSWNIGFSVKYKRGVSAYPVKLIVTYTSGVDQANVDSYIREIPLTVICDRR